MSSKNLDMLGTESPIQSALNFSIALVVYLHAINFNLQVKEKSV